MGVKWELTTKTSQTGLTTLTAHPSEGGGELCCSTTEPANARDLMTSANGCSVKKRSFVFAFTYTLGRLEGAMLVDN